MNCFSNSPLRVNINSETHEMASMFERCVLILCSRRSHWKNFGLHGLYKKTSALLNLTMTSDTGCRSTLCLSAMTCCFSIIKQGCKLQKCVSLRPSPGCKPSLQSAVYTSHPATCYLRKRRRLYHVCPRRHRNLWRRMQREGRICSRTKKMERVEIRELRKS